MGENVGENEDFTLHYFLFLVSEITYYVSSGS